MSVIYNLSLYSVYFKNIRIIYISETILMLVVIDLVRVFDAISTSRQTREKLQCLYQGHPTTIFGKLSVRKTI